ncbi:RICIN domain-containing protein [Nocardia sp. NPDC051052]|uniref:RICIN domain-containing protein n=1 Tax=Nocardia sp. NPDC051052 TaxID=3364322 RepID=UPI0037BD9060
MTMVPGFGRKIFRVTTVATAIAAPALMLLPHASALAGVRVIKSVSSGNCVESHHHAVDISPCRDISDQRWEIEGSTIKNLSADECLESDYNGSHLTLSPCRDLSSQRWEIAGATIKDVSSGSCLESAYNGSRVRLAECRDVTSQKWELRDAPPRPAK